MYKNIPFVGWCLGNFLLTIWFLLPSMKSWVQLTLLAVYFITISAMTYILIGKDKVKDVVIIHPTHESQTGFESEITTRENPTAKKKHLKLV